MQYISFEPNTADRYILSPEVKKDGIYEIYVEFEYYYHGKTHRVSTDKVTFIWKNPYQQWSPEAKSETTRDYAWLTGYWEAEYEEKSKRFEGSPFTKEWILSGSRCKKNKFLAWTDNRRSVSECRRSKVERSATDRVFLLRKNV